MYSTKGEAPQGRLRSYRKPGELAWCQQCGAPLCIHLKRFCSDECKRTWFEKQPDIDHVCTKCGTHFMGKPWRERCTACWKAGQ